MTKAPNQEASPSGPSATEREEMLADRQAANHLLRDERELLELEKLRFEIRELTKPWWKRPQYLAVFVPLWISAFALIAAWASGWFDLERQTLKKEKMVLQRDLSSLRLQIARSRESLASTQAILAKERKRVGDAIGLLDAARLQYASVAEILRTEHSGCTELVVQRNAEFEQRLSRLMETVYGVGGVVGAEKLMHELKRSAVSTERQGLRQRTRSP